MHIKSTLQESLEEMETHPKFNLVIENRAEGNYDGIPPKGRTAESRIVKWEKRRDLRYYSLSSALSPKKDIFQYFWTSFVQ